MNIKFIIRGTVLGVLATALISGVWIFYQMPLSRLLFLPSPSSPIIHAPQGEMPAGPVGFQTWNQYPNLGYTWGGSGFFLRLENGEVVGVASAHGTYLHMQGNPLQQVAFQIAGLPGYIDEFDILRGPPGHHFAIDDMTSDYILFQVNQPIAPEMVLAPDPRGAPQPGERVTLFGGTDGSIHEGTVQLVTDTAAWVLMDEQFYPHFMSGSPIVSQHTGQMVGMAVAATNLRKGVYVGMNPGGAIAQHAESATEFIKIIELDE